MGWKHYQTVDHPKREPQVGSGLFGIRLLILHFKFQFTKSIKSSTVHISLNLTYPLRKNISFQKCPKITQKFTQNRLTVVNRNRCGWCYTDMHAHTVALIFYDVKKKPTKKISAYFSCVSFLKMLQKFIIHVNTS